MAGINTVSGDFAALDSLIKGMSSIASGEQMQELSKVLAEEARTQILMGFEESRDPYGKPWKPITYRDGKPLLDTGRLRNSFTPHSHARGFQVDTNVKYAPTHQYGAVIKAKKPGKPLKFKIKGQWISKYQVTIPRRQMIPENDTGGLGDIWGNAFAAATQEFMQRVLGM